MFSCSMVMVIFLLGMKNNRFKIRSSALVSSSKVRFGRCPEKAWLNLDPHNPVVLINRTFALGDIFKMSLMPEFPPRDSRPFL